MTPESLPFGFEGHKFPSMSEVDGKHASASKTWINEHSDVSAREVEMLDQIESIEKSIDSELAKIDDTAHVANEDFEQNVVHVETPIFVDSKDEPEEPNSLFPPVEFEARVPRLPLDAIAAAEAIKNDKVTATESAQYKQMLASESQKLKEEIVSLQKQLSKTNSDLRGNIKTLKASGVGPKTTQTIERVVALEPQDQDSDKDTTQYIVVIVMAATLLTMCILVLYLLRTFRNHQKQRRQAQQANHTQF